MQKTISIFFLLLLLWRPVPGFTQPGAFAGNLVDEEKEKFLRGLGGNTVDYNLARSLMFYLDSAVTRINSSIEKDSKLSAIEKDKAARSLVFFMKELNGNLARQKMYLYEIPAALQEYNNTLRAILAHKPLTPVLVPLDARHSQLLASAFSQYKENSLLDDIAVYKRMAASPDFILPFLESKPNFRFADSLLLLTAAHDPQKLVYYLNKDDRGVQNRIRGTKNIYLQQIIALSKDKNVSEFLPFTIQIAEKRIVPDTILAERTNAMRYFQLMVNTLIQSLNSEDAASIFLEPLRNGIKQKALSFYVNSINELHSSAEAIRFASVKGLRPEDLYYIITSCGDELYTSSYLGLFRRLMEHFPNQSADSLFGLVRYDNFRVFMRLAANYNVLADFLHSMPRDKEKEMLTLFMAGLDSDPNTGLEKAMDIADCFTALAPDDEIFELLRSELQANLKRCAAGRQYLCVRLYSILSDVLNMVKYKDGKLWSTLGNYEVLKQEALVNKKGEIVQAVLFYGDEDGVASFNNYLKLFADTRKWKITKNENWVSIHPVLDSSFIIYANRPLDVKEQMDLAAQESLFAYLQQQSQEPAILVHRGHSYHLDKTLKRLGPSVRLAILGSCGGYNKAISIAGVNPDVQVIGSKKTGAGSVNDPILSVIDETLISKQDLYWPDIWNRLTERFKADEEALNLFNEYFPPGKNLSLFVLKLFVYYNRNAF